MTKGQFTCFLHPNNDLSEHCISDLCPECRRPYSYPLDSAPSRIRSYDILKPVGRGFYAVTYLATYGALRTRCVLKVTPQITYRYFCKEFFSECQLHREVSQGTLHLAEIIDAFDEEVEFGDTTIPCHVAHLDYVDGDTLADFLSDSRNRTARNIAQIAVDLFTLMQELSTKQKYHNDLHDKNIIVQRLERSSFRAGDTIEPSIRAVAIDLGSLAEVSKSLPSGERLGDLLQVARHILSFRNYLLENPDAISDMDFRLAVQIGSDWTLVVARSTFST